MSCSPEPPEVGQAVRVRNRLATVRAVESYDSREAAGAVGAGCGAVRADRAASDGARLVEKKLPDSIDFKRECAGPDHPRLSVRQQCELLGLNRSTWYYEPLSVSA